MQVESEAATPQKRAAPMTPAKLAWRLIKRRIISLPDSHLALAVSSRERFAEWLRWIAEPAILLKLIPTGAG